MSESESEIHSIHTEMQNFLRSVARREPTPSSPVYLRVEYKNGLKLFDKDKRQFNVEESFLSAFRQTYTDKSFKSVRLHNWEFELEFQGKQCKKINLISDTVVFIASKNLKKEINGCLFKVQIVENEAGLKSFSSELNGYLNRLGKRHICSYSDNIAKKADSLLSFITVAPAETKNFNYKPYLPAELDQFEPVSLLNPEGKKILEKLRNFVTRQQVYDYIVDQEISHQTGNQLRKVALGGK